jgi:transposase
MSTLKLSMDRKFCEAHAIIYARIPGLAIKKSMGITRGKNDQVDSARIAQYGEEKYKSLQPSKPLNPEIIGLKELLAFRKRLVRENAGYKSSIKEREHMYGKNRKDIIVKSLQQKLKANSKVIENVEAEMMQIIIQDEEMHLNFTLITSIKGIGKVNGLMTIAYTENFSSFNNPRSYAVYVGVIPFDHSSGTSIRGRKRVSHIAKFKLILRMFAVAKKGEMYVDNYKNVA